MKIEVSILEDLLSRSVKIYIHQIDESTGKVFIAKKMDFIFEELEENVINEPSLHLKLQEGRNFLNNLSQALINSGFRDKSISKDGEIKRMTDHLEDMRKIAFKFIDKTA